jgi:hypothetical protein
MLRSYTDIEILHIYVARQQITEPVMKPDAERSTTSAMALDLPECEARPGLGVHI